MTEYVQFKGALKMAEKELKSKLASLPVSSLANTFLVFVIVLGAFYVGGLTTKLKMLESGEVPSQKTQPTAVADKTVPTKPAPSADNLPEITPEDHVRGDTNARIALIEYSDLECPFCKSFHPTAQQAVDEYQGQLKWVYRHFPLNFHANAQKESEASECVNELGGNDAFWKFVDAIYEKTTSNGQGFALDKLGPLAAEIGVNQTQFQTCLDSGKYTQKVQDEASDGTTAGITGTPGNILLDTQTGKTTVIPGAVPYAQLKQAIDAMLRE